MSLYYQERDTSEFYAAAVRVSNNFVPMESESGQVGMITEYEGDFEKTVTMALPGVDPENVVQHCIIETVSKHNVPFTVVKSEDGIARAVAGVGG